MAQLLCSIKKHLLFICLLGLLCIFPSAAQAQELPLLEAAESGGKSVADGLHVTSTGKIYFYKDGVRQKNCWKTVSGKRYHFGSTGAADIGWTRIGSYVWYFRKDGTMYTGWRKTPTGTWYFDLTTGKRASGFKTIDGNTYYFRANGTAVTGWLDLNGKHYNFRSNYTMRTGWAPSGDRYFSVYDGHMITGWTWLSQKAYYFNPETGKLARSTWIGDRYVGSDGAWNKAKKPTMTSLKSQIAAQSSGWYGTWSVYVKNLNTGESFSVNNQSMYAASEIKLFAMGSVYQKISQGLLSEGSLANTIRLMITVSDNWSFNHIIRNVGINYVNAWDKAHGYTQTNQGHGLSPAGNEAGLRNGTGSNLTSPQDCGKILESIYRGTCVNKVYSSKMLNHLLGQQVRHKIPAGLPGGTKCANKTGETDDYTHDAAIVWSPKATYILVVMGKTPGAGYAQTYHIRDISRMVYNYLN